VPNKNQQMQAIIRQYRDETGETDIDMRKVARFAAKMGWPLSQPIDPVDMLAKEFSRAAREEIKYDKVTGKPYRVNHAIPADGGQLRLWVDIDKAPRPKMLKSLINRREQMVGDGLQLSLDADHWNSINPQDEPIDIPLDFTDDVEWRKNAPDEDEDEKAS
jgi:hypothetical protein